MRRVPRAFYVLPFTAAVLLHGCFLFGGWDMKKIVEIKNITKSFDGEVVLDNINLDIYDNEFITLLGPSGCGKTTLLRIIGGFETPDQGDVIFMGENINGLPPHKRNVNTVFQRYALFPHLNVFENVAYPLQIQKQDKGSIREAVDRVLETVHLSQYAERLPSQLSGGQQQRVALARALVAAPKLLLLDEPLSNLDAKLRESMRFEIKEIQKRTGITVVYVTHDQTEAMAMSDRIFVINRGEVQQTGTPEEIYNHPANPFVADFLGKVDFFRGEVKDGRIFFPEMGNQSIPVSIPVSGTVKKSMSVSGTGATASITVPTTAPPVSGTAKKSMPVGKVYAAVRPENLLFTEDGELSGTLETQYYLGDVDDCRVRIGSTLVRVITDGAAYRRMQKGQSVRLTVRDLMVFPDDGSLEEMLKIRT